MFYKKGVSENFEKFIGKHLCFIKKRLLLRCFPVNFAKVLRTPPVTTFGAFHSLKQKQSYGDVLYESALKNLRNSQENNGARVSFSIKLKAWVCNFIKKETLAQVVSCEICKSFSFLFLQSTFSQISRPVVASVKNSFLDGILAILLQYFWCFKCAFLGVFSFCFSIISANSHSQSLLIPYLNS